MEALFAFSNLHKKFNFTEETFYILLFSSKIGKNKVQWETFNNLLLPTYELDSRMEKHKCVYGLPGAQTDCRAHPG